MEAAHEYLARPVLNGSHTCVFVGGIPLLGKCSADAVNETCRENVDCLSCQAVGSHKCVWCDGLSCMEQGSISLRACTMLGGRLQIGESCSDSKAGESWTSNSSSADLVALEFRQKRIVYVVGLILGAVFSAVTCALVVVTNRRTNTEKFASPVPE